MSELKTQLQELYFMLIGLAIVLFVAWVVIKSAWIVLCRAWGSAFDCMAGQEGKQASRFAAAQLLTEAKPK